MKAALCTSLDGPAALQLAALPQPVPGPGEALIRVTAAALNFLDTLITRGKYQMRPPLPFSPGAEIAGVIEAFGPPLDTLPNTLPDTKSDRRLDDAPLTAPRQIATPSEGEALTIGMRVCCFIGWGGARTHIVVAVDQLIRVPDGVSDSAAAGMSVTYGTALHGLKDRGQLVAGQSVAILGASGGAGMAAVEVAKLLGARVIAAASSDERLQLCRDYGADDTINYKTQDLKARLKQLGGAGGIDIIYDCIGGEYAQLAVRAMAWQGRYLVIGFAAGSIAHLPLNLVLLKGCDICGVYWAEAVKRDPAGHRQNMNDILRWIKTGVLAPHIHVEMPLSQIRAAVDLLDKRRARGKVIITMD